MVFVALTVYGCASQGASEVSNVKEKKSMSEFPAEKVVENKTSPLWYELRNSVFHAEFDHAEALLKKHPELRKLTNNTGETVLHFLSVENDLRGVKWLFEHGFDLNTKDNYGVPVIFEVAGLGYKDLFLWFKSNGVNLNAVNKHGEGVLDHFALEDNPEMKEWVRNHIK